MTAAPWTMPCTPKGKKLLQLLVSTYADPTKITKKMVRSVRIIYPAPRRSGRPRIKPLLTMTPLTVDDCFVPTAVKRVSKSVTVNAVMSIVLHCCVPFPNEATD